MVLLSCIYMGLTLLEPAQSRDETFYQDNPNYQRIVLGIEAVILAFYFIDNFLHALHLRNDRTRAFVQKYVTNMKFLLQVTVSLCFIMDFIVFHAKSPTPVLRFSRVLRPSKNNLMSGFFKLQIKL